MDALELLERIDFATSTPDVIRNIIKNTEIPFLPFYVKAGVYILRGRRGAGFIKRSQMTYCPARLCISMQRASFPYHTMFYGVLSDNQAHQENARAMVAGECSK